MKRHSPSNAKLLTNAARGNLRKRADGNNSINFEASIRTFKARRRGQLNCPKKPQDSEPLHAAQRRRCAASKGASPLRVGTSGLLDRTPDGTNNFLRSFFVAFRVRRHPHSFSPKVRQVSQELLH
jgi:hypothetical protein